MEDAAIGGVPQAQYFMGNAYRNGQGVEKNLALALVDQRRRVRPAACGGIPFTASPPSAIACGPI